MKITEKVGKVLQSYPYATGWWVHEESTLRALNGSTVWERFKDGIEWLWIRDPLKGIRLNRVPYLWRFRMIWYAWRDKYKWFDSQLDGTNHFMWQEDADYVVLVQPKVGEVIGQFLLDEPDHPHAIKIAEAVKEASERANAD